MNIKILVITIFCLHGTKIACQQPNVQVLLDLKPEEVQKLLAQQNTDLSFAPLINTIQVPKSSPDEPDQIEDIYQVSQFHGQDGLGRYLYGYSNPADAKVEGKNGAGHVRGGYNWIDRRGKVIKVKYWDTGNGFHHEDNLPKVVLKPVEETPTLRAARLAHEAAWKAAAQANKVSPSQYRLVYKDNSYSGAETQDFSVTANPENDGQYHPELYDETTSEPRGFFYSASYPAGARYRTDEYDGKRIPIKDDIVSFDGTLD